MNKKLKKFGESKMNKHTFVICAYKESPFLEECIQSVLSQSLKSKVKIVTSTPCAYIFNMAKKYNIPLVVNKNDGGIVQDWNFAYAQADTPLVTITHQDDIYCEDYLKNILWQFRKHKKPLIFFTDYGEIRGEEYVKTNKLLKVKRIMLKPLEISKFSGSIFLRRRILSLGSPICCPSVTYVKPNLPKQIFDVGFRSDEDWQAWEKLSKLKGEFVYSKKILMYHRIHNGSETTAIISDTGRAVEDYQMFCKFWPKWIAKLLVKFYSTSEESNNL